jgi:glycosyltransferase involved in cell wall biosynthesis
LSESRLLLIANARMPSQRAQSLQVAQVAGAFQRAGTHTTLLHARRVPTPELPVGETLWSYYGVEGEPSVEAVPCVDWIDRVPRGLQYVPARVQELTFGRNAARRALRDEGARVLSRELETAALLARAGHQRLFLEVHRVPEGARRRAWLLEAARGARGVVAISGGVREDLEAAGVSGEALRVEHDGYEAARFEALPSRGEARAELGVAPGARLVVYTGGFLTWKGVEVLVDAARAMPDVEFVLAGGMDADVARVRAYAAGAANVRLDGFQPPARVPLYLAAADATVVPNLAEPAISARYTSPLKVFEAMAAGVPLVASDLPSLRDVLTHDEDALLVPPGDPAALAEGLSRLLGDEALRARMSERLLSRAGEHTWDARARRLLTWMDEREAA